MPHIETTEISDAPQTDRRLRGRDLINIGIFFVLYFVLTMIPMFIAGVHPLLWVLFPGFAAILGSIPYLLLCARVQKPFAILIMGIIFALVCASTGNFTIVLILIVFTSILTELIRWRTGYASYKGNAVSFILFSFGWLASPLPIWLFHDSFMQQIQTQGMAAEYVAACSQISTPPFLILCIGFTVVGALVGVLITQKLFKKHFIKAGLA